MDNFYQAFIDSWSWNTPLYMFLWKGWGVGEDVWKFLGNGKVLLLVILVQVLAQYTGDLWELSQDLWSYLVLIWLVVGGGGWVVGAALYLVLWTRLVMRTSNILWLRGGLLVGSHTVHWRVWNTDRGSQGWGPGACNAGVVVRVWRAHGGHAVWGGWALHGPW